MVSCTRNFCKIKKFIGINKNIKYLCRAFGVLAQLVERLNGIQKVRSSILLCSTKIQNSNLQ